MLRRAVRDITGMRIHGTDGDLGHVRDVYFDDAQWRVTYLQVDPRHWLIDRHVLLAPTVVRSLDWEHGRIHVSLTREQVRSSPDIDPHKPVSRQQRMPLHEYFQWPFGSSDWVSEDVELAVALHKLLIETRGNAVTTPVREETHPRLWSARALSHYGVEGSDGDLGRVDDFWCFRHVGDSPSRDRETSLASGHASARGSDQMDHWKPSDPDRAGSRDGRAPPRVIDRYIA